MPVRQYISGHASKSYAALCRLAGNRRFRRAALAVVVLVVVGMFYLLNTLTPFCRDDYAYAQEANKLMLLKGMADQQIVQINQAKAQNETSVTLQRIVTSTKYSVYFREWDLTEDPARWSNSIMARYYGIAEIRSEQRDEFLL